MTHGKVGIHLTIAGTYMLHPEVNKVYSHVFTSHQLQRNQVVQKPCCSLASEVIPFGRGKQMMLCHQILPCHVRASQHYHVFTRFTKITQKSTLNDMSTNVGHMTIGTICPVMPMGCYPILLLTQQAIHSQMHMK